MATMLLGGLWHGANWTFVIWGGLHGAYLIVTHAWQAIRARLNWGGESPLGTAFARALTFFAVAIAWVFFRANNFEAATTMLRAMFRSTPSSLWLDLRHNPMPQDTPTYVVAMFATGLLIVNVLPNAQELAAHMKQPKRSLQAFGIGLFVAAIFILVAISASRGVSEFIYFNF
jgi:D-alanyl-lipoteichoic acid acyltransferase DltB (MBOAT superfamily)